MKPSGVAVSDDRLTPACHALLGHHYTPVNPAAWHKRGLEGRQLKVIGFKRPIGQAHAIFDHVLIPIIEPCESLRDYHRNLHRMAT
jgi:hypothetical protein